jgi:hypothetical protein
MIASCFQQPLPCPVAKLRKIGGAVMRSIHLLALLALAFGAGLPNHALAQSKFFSFEQNINRPGGDYDNAPSRGAADCSFTCQQANNCRAWSYVRAGVQGTSGRCWLKNSVPQARRDTCCTSGVRKGKPTRIDDD